MGVPNEYVIEFFAPGLDDYEVFHNVTIDDAGDELYGDDDEDYAADGDDDTSWDDDDDAG